MPQLVQKGETRILSRSRISYFRFEGILEAGIETIRKYLNSPGSLKDIRLLHILLNLSQKGDAETVWATRICPARAVIKNIPFPESGRRYNDIVLNDGASNGYRMSDGKEYPVFDELEHLLLSDYQTFSIRCELPNREVYDMLERKCKEADIMVENWTTQVVLYCKQCSEGRPHEQHDHELATDAEHSHHTIAFATTSTEALDRILESWHAETDVEYDEYFRYD